MAEGSSKIFKVAYEGQKKLVTFSGEGFLQKCRERFKIGDTVEITLVDEDDFDVDEESLRNLTTTGVLTLKQTTRNKKEEADSKEKQTYEDNKADILPRSDQIPVPNFDVENGEAGSKKKQTHKAEVQSGSDEFLPLEIDLSNDKAVQEYVDSHKGFSIDIFFDDILDAWKRKDVKIAIIGLSGKGKSTLINALRSVPNTDRNAAATGAFAETTQKPTPYRHPDFDNIVLWDVPGCGTKQFPQKSYLDDIEWQQYDFFIVLTADRFFEAEYDIVEELTECNKNVYLVRTKIDLVMDSIRREKGAQMDDDVDFSNIKTDMKIDILRNLKDIFRPSNLVLFLISSIFPHLYDFPHLQRKLADDASIQKKLTIIFGLTAFSSDFLQKKKKQLEARMEIIAIYAMIEGDSHAELKFKCTLKIIQNELDFYRCQFALNDAPLHKLAQSMGLTSSDVKKNVVIRSPPVTSDEELKSMLAQYYMQPDDEFSRSFSAKYKEQHSLLKSMLTRIINTLCKDQESKGLDLSVLNDENAISAIVSTLLFFLDVMLSDAESVMKFLVEKGRDFMK